MAYLESKLRLISGLVLAAYVIQHFVNHAFGIVSFEAAEAYRQSIATVFQVWPGQVLLYGAFLFHGAIALKSIYQKSSLRLPLWHWMQLVFGLAVLPLLAGHVIFTRGMDIAGGLDPDYYYEIALLLSSPERIGLLGVLALIIWTHMSIGLHYWLRLKRGYQRLVPYLYSVVVLIPVLAAAGIFSLLQDALVWIDDDDRMDEIFLGFDEMDASTLEFMLNLEDYVLVAMGLLLTLVLAARQCRLWLQLRKGTFAVFHSNGKKVRAQAGLTLLEAMRSARIPHASICGGRGRCTTCRVRIGSGLSSLDAPNGLEAPALAKIERALISGWRVKPAREAISPSRRWCWRSSR